MAQRTIEGPEKDLLDIREVAAYLRMNVRTLRRLIAAGQFPHPLELSPGTRAWTAEDVAVFRAWAERRPRLKVEPVDIPENPEGQGVTPEVIEGHGVTTGPRSRKGS